MQLRSVYGVSPGAWGGSTQTLGSQYSTALHCTALFCTALHCTVLYYNILFFNALKRILLYWTAPNIQLWTNFKLWLWTGLLVWIPSHPIPICSGLKIVYFNHGPVVSWSMVMAPPFTELTNHLTSQTTKDISVMACKHCGGGKISRHYGVGHRSVPCRPLLYNCFS